MKMLQLITCSASVLWTNNAQLRYPAAPVAVLPHASEEADAAAAARLPTAFVLVKLPIHALANANPGLCRRNRGAVRICRNERSGGTGKAAAAGTEKPKV